MFNGVDSGTYVLILGLAALTYMFAGWFADVISESIAGKYSKQVDEVAIFVVENEFAIIQGVK